MRDCFSTERFSFSLDTTRHTLKRAKGKGKKSVGGIYKQMNVLLIITYVVHWAKVLALFVSLDKQRLSVLIAHHTSEMSNIISRVCNLSLMSQAESEPPRLTSAASRGLVFNYQRLTGWPWACCTHFESMLAEIRSALLGNQEWWGQKEDLRFCVCVSYPCMCVLSALYSTQRKVAFKIRENIQIFLFCHPQCNSF